MRPASARSRRLWLASAATLAFTPSAFPQNSNTLPTITVQAERQTTGGDSLTVPTAQQAMAEIERTPGGVAIVRGEDYKASTPAATLKDVLDYVPGVFVQPKWGEDSRLSIRGSGLSRKFHLRGVQLYLDGIPINTADGYGDFQEIDPTAYRYAEVYKGANALRYGAVSIGGTINFVTPSGRDAPLAAFSVDLGSFGFARTRHRRQVPAAVGTDSSPPRHNVRAASATTARATRSAAAATSATRSRRTSRPAST